MASSKQIQKDIQPDWFVLYNNLKSNIDQLLVSHPKKLKNLLNFNKLVNVPEFDRVLQHIKYKRHYLLQQEIDLNTSRRSLLYRIRKWYSNKFDTITVPYMIPPNQNFIKRAREYFSISENSKNVLVEIIGYFENTYPFFTFVVKTGHVEFETDRYRSNELYVIIICKNETIYVAPQNIAQFIAI